MKTLFIFIILLLLSSSLLFSQVSVTTDGRAPDSSAMLDVQSVNKGVLIPRMTTDQRNAIVRPADGLLIFNLTTGCIDYYLGGSWKSFYGVTNPVFQCNMKLYDSRDGKSYNTVKIDTLCWMAENLTTSTYRNGDPIPNVTDNLAWRNLTTGAYCWYNNDSATYGSTYGRLYNGYAVKDNRNLCPTGWHVPTTDEWTALTNYLGGASVAGGKMKESGLAHWLSPNVGATNVSGFTALPGGYRSYYGYFSSLPSEAMIWSSSAYSNNLFYRRLHYDSEVVEANGTDIGLGFSVRCIED